jgi:thiol-disulfide isomerase/thioredoxin
MKPHVAKLVEKYPDQVKIFNVDENEGLDAALLYDITSVPTFILERDGQARRIHSGSMSPAQLEAFVS